MATVPGPTLSWRGGVRTVAERFVEHDLLTYASAISFQVLSAIVPFLLFGFGLLGFLNLEDVWREELAPELRASVSRAAFTVIDDVVETAQSSRQLFWVTAGLALALWQISGAVRAVMGAVNTIYRRETTRSWARRMLVSFGLGLAVGALLLAAVAVAVLGPLLYGDVGPAGDVVLVVARWLAVAALLVAVVALLVRVAPEDHQPLPRVGYGTALIVGTWLLMSAGLGFYLREIADYGSVFSNLATVVVLIGYVYASSLIFLGGVQLDALGREQPGR